jgi:hypothetical protein
MRAGISSLRRKAENRTGRPPLKVGNGNAAGVSKRRPIRVRCAILSKVKSPHREQSLTIARLPRFLHNFASFLRQGLADATCAAGAER